MAVIAVSMTAAASMAVGTFLWRWVHSEPDPF
jgi:hypothetical protein